MAIKTIEKFKDREEAAAQLIAKLDPSMLLENWFILATSYGGLPLARYISQNLGYKYDILFSEKIYSSVNNECEIAIITETNEVIIHEELLESFEIKIGDIFDEAQKIYNNEILTNIKRFRNSKKLDFKDRNILFVDEGVNTGLTMMACIKSAIILGARSVCIAVPILPTVTAQEISARADDLYFIKEVDHFVDIEFYYNNLEIITKQDIKGFL